MWEMCRSEGLPAQWMVSDIVGQEPKAERSLMHRFNIALVGLLRHHRSCQASKQVLPLDMC